MRKPRKTYKGHTFSIRVPEKVRYGLELLSRKKQVQMSTLVLRAIESMFEEEGLSEPGQMFTLLDKLWSESPAHRLLALTEIAPELSTQEERRLAHALRECGITEGQNADDFLWALTNDSVIFDPDEPPEMRIAMAGAWFRSWPALKKKFSNERDFLDWLKSRFP